MVYPIKYLIDINVLQLSKCFYCQKKEIPVSNSFSWYYYKFVVIKFANVQNKIIVVILFA